MVGGVHIETPMDPSGVIIVHVGPKHATQTPLVEHDRMIECLSPNTADNPLAVWMLPRRSGRNLHLVDAHVDGSLLKLSAVDRAPVP